MKKYFVFVVLSTALLLTACGNIDALDSTSLTEFALVEEMPAESAAGIDISGIFSDRDYEVGYDESKSAFITLSGSSASSGSDAVQVSGSTVSITDEGTYVFSGELDDGMIIVNAQKGDKTQLVLDGVKINSETSAAIYILQADKVFITTTRGSVNVLSNGGRFESIDDNNIDGTIFSKEDMTLNGEGSLTISAPSGHGIVCKDALSITSGSYEITSASHGISGKDNVCISNAELTIDAGKDGIQAEHEEDAALGFVYLESGTFQIEAEGDGISASSSLQILGGTFKLSCGGGSVNGEQHSSGGWGGFGGGGGMDSPRDHGNPGGHSDMEGEEISSGSAAAEEDSTSMKGIKAEGEVLICGGIFTIDAADDAIHSDTSAGVAGGSFTIASGDDAFHAEETLEVSAGEITITQCYEGLEALNVHVSGGKVTMQCSDDGINAAGGTDASGFGGRDNGRFGGAAPGGMGGASNGSVLISGGEIFIQSSGDGIDANGALTISGGYTIVCGPTQGDTATLDYDTSATITGGTFIGTGAYGMAQTFSDSEQGVIALSVGTQAAGANIVLEDLAGNVILSYAPDLDFAVVILSSHDLVKGENYKITVGGASGEFTAS